MNIIILASYVLYHYPSSFQRLMDTVLFFFTCNLILFNFLTNQSYSSKMLKLDYFWSVYVEVAESLNIPCNHGLLDKFTSLFANRICGISIVG